MVLWLSIAGFLYLARFGIIAIELIGRFEPWGLAERGANAFDCPRDPDPRGQTGYVSL